MATKNVREFPLAKGEKKKLRVLMSNIHKNRAISASLARFSFRRRRPVPNTFKPKWRGEF